METEVVSYSDLAIMEDRAAVIFWVVDLRAERWLL